MSKQLFSTPTGMHDILPDDQSYWEKLRQEIFEMAKFYDFGYVETPVLEQRGVFDKSLGVTSETVEKEMYTLKTKGGDELALRTEGTPPIMRAYLQHGWESAPQPVKVFYLGQMFRHESPQAGRYRQFHQYGVEAIGSASPWVDVEVIALCVHILRDCGVAQPTVWVASMGCRNDQARSAEALRKRLEPHKHALCKECQARLERKVFRALDCKKPGCREIVWAGKPSPFVLCADCQEHFAEVRRGLQAAGVAFDDTQAFARGLDYYTRTVFEVRAKGLGAQDAVAAGGRYDHLVEEFGGPALGAAGFATGIERLLLAADAALTEPLSIARRGLYLALAEQSLLGEGFRFVQELRARGVWTGVDFDGKSLKAQLREADKGGYQLVAVLGQAELKERSITLKDLGDGAQRNVSLDSFVNEVAEHANTTCH